MLFSSFSTRSMVFAYFAKAQLPFSLFRDLFNDTAEFTLCYGLHDCSHLFQGYFIHSLSTLYYYNAPSLTTRLTGDYRDRTYTGKCSPALLDTRKRKAAPVLAHQSGEHIRRCTAFSAKILYHLRGSHASGTFVRAGCYFCTYFSRHLRRRNKKKKPSR